MGLKVIIVEDEAKSRDTLRHLLQRFCKTVEIVGEAATVQEAIGLIEREKPQVVFLDIELPRESGFRLLQYFPQAPFDVIFTTAYDQYAVQAFRLAAVDYLLKPIDVEQLQEAVAKVKAKEKDAPPHAPLEWLAGDQWHALDKLALPTSEGYSFIEMDRIIFCEANRSYTLFHLSDEQRILVSKPLKFFEELLPTATFFRISRSYIVHLKHIQKYSRAQQGSITLVNGQVLSISEQKRESFLKRILGK